MLFEAEANTLLRVQQEDKDEEKEAKMAPGEPALAWHVFERGSMLLIFSMNLG